MEEKYDHYEYLRYELFEELIPRMLYQDTGEEQNDFFQLLLQENGNLIYDMYKTLCEDDGLPCPYKRKDFEAAKFERGGVNILQMLTPRNSPEISGVLRAYLLYMKHGDGGFMKKYFVIRRFQNGNVFNLYITPEAEGVLGEELTGHAGDMEYEYWKLVRDFTRIMIQDMHGAH